MGRVAERELFHAALLANEFPFVVLHMFGSGVVGKSTLLHELARPAEAHGRPVLHLDERHLEPTTDALECALQTALQSTPAPILFLDTYETFHLPGQMVAPLWL